VFAEADPLSASYVMAHEAFIPSVYRDVPFMAISESTRDDLVHRGLSAEHVTVVHCGMDHERYRPSAPKADEPGAPTNAGLGPPYNNLGVPGATSIDLLTRTGETALMQEPLDKVWSMALERSIVQPGKCGLASSTIALMPSCPVKSRAGST